MLLECPTQSKFANNVLCLLQELKDCFESKDISQLQQAIAKMKRLDAEYHMKRCVDSGLWVPGGGKDAEEDKDKEPVYATIPGDEEQPEKWLETKTRHAGKLLGM